MGGVAQPLHTTQTHIPRHKHMRAQTQPSSPPQTPHTHLDPRPDPRSTLCHADPATRTLPHTHTLTLFLSLSLSHTHWQHTGSTLTDTQTCTHKHSPVELTVSRFWSTVCSARLHACRESDRLPAQHTEQTHVSKTAPRHAGMQEKQGDARDTYVTHSDTNRSQIRSQITIWDLPEASRSPGTGTSWRRQCGWGSVPSPDGTHLCSQEVTRHTTHIWQGSFTTELKPVLLQLGLSSPAQADTHAPVYRLALKVCGGEVIGEMR